MTDEVKVLSDDALREIEARVAKATPAPLETRIGSGNNVCTALASNNPATFDDFVCDVLPDYACKPGIATRWEANREFIQHAYSDIPALCATVRALRAEIIDYEQTDLIPRSRYVAADADREEARQQFRDIAKKATVEIERLESENTALREQLAEARRLHADAEEDYASQLLKVSELQSRLAQVTEERNRYADALESATKGIKCDD